MNAVILGAGEGKGFRRAAVGRAHALQQIMHGLTFWKNYLISERQIKIARA